MIDSGLTEGGGRHPGSDGEGEPQARALSLKLDRLEELLRRRAPVVVALSGGVDSSLLYALARRLLGDRAVAVIGISPSLSADDLTSAREVAAHLEAPLWEVETYELERAGYRANSGDRCYHCKLELFGRIAGHPRLAGWTVCDGTNADDAAADRPGITAAGDVGVISPLREARIGKAEIRKLASELGLPNRERPSRPCLASRVRVGTPVDAATLRRVAALEGILERAGFRIYRARTCGDEVTVVLGGDEMARLGEPGWRHELVCEALRQGYRRIVVDLLGYRPPGERGEESGEREEQPRPL